MPGRLPIYRDINFLQELKKPSNQARETGPYHSHETVQGFLTSQEAERFGKNVRRRCALCDVLCVFICQGCHVPLCSVLTKENKNISCWQAWHTATTDIEEERNKRAAKSGSKRLRNQDAAASAETPPVFLGTTSEATESPLRDNLSPEVANGERQGNVQELGTDSESEAQPEGHQDSISESPEASTTPDVSTNERTSESVSGPARRSRRRKK